MLNYKILRDKRGDMTSSELLSNLDQYATLATRLDFLNVTSFSLDCHVCHVSHKEKVNEVVNYSDSQACLQWLSVVMEEGHLEASQPIVGRAIGWPQRMVALRSLWVDFTFWCLKMRMSKNEIPEQWVFYGLLDRLFIRKGDKYELPALEDCRGAFVILRQNYECN